MRIPPVPANEAERLKDLHDYDILDTPPERVFDEIAELAATLCGTPCAAITLVDRARQWFKAEHGLRIGESPRELSVCGHAILEGGYFEVPDAREDARFAGNPLLAGGAARPGLRFYGGCPLTSEGGRAIGMVCVLDTEPRRLGAAQQHALAGLANVVMALLEGKRQSRRTEWFGALVDEVSEEILIIDPETYRYLHANAGALRHLGYGLDELRRLTPVDITPTLSQEEFLGHMQRLREGARQVVYEGLRRPARGAPYPVEVRWQRLSTGGRPVILSIVHDISERKAVERMKDEFISVVNHELRTPLTSIHGAIKLLERGAGGALPEGAAKLVNLASLSNDRLLHLIDDILDLEKIACGRMRIELQPVGAAAALDAVARAHEALATLAGVTLRVEAPPDLAVRADALRLQQVLGNLVSNALKFAPPGSTVELAAGRAGDARVRLCVSDRGPGVPEHFRPRLFERFAQAEMDSTRPQGGSGLGLSIVKKLTELMHGRVGCESRPGHTRFEVELPEALA